MANKKTDNPLKTEDESFVASIVDDYNSSWNYTSGNYHELWQHMYKLYNSERTRVGYNGTSDTFVPMAYSTIETMTAATSGEKPSVEFIPTKNSQSEETGALNDLYSMYWDLDNWTNKDVIHNRSLFIYGTAVDRYYWNIDHPVRDLIPLRDFFCDPAARLHNYNDSARYMGHRFLASKSLMSKEMVVNPDTKQLEPKFKNLDKLSSWNDSGEQTDKEQKDTMMGSTLDKNAQRDQIEVICHETLDEITYIGNREQVIYHHKNYFKERQEFLGYENPRGMYSYAIDAYDAEESLLYGSSALKPIWKPQEMLNDITNQNVDAVSWALDPLMELDPQYSSYMGKIRNVIGAIMPFKPGSLMAVQKPTVPYQAFTERQNIKSEIREASGVDSIIRGVSSSNNNRVTAAEIRAQVQSANRRFDLLLRQLENGGYYTAAKLVFQMIQLYVTTPTMVRILGETGVEWQKFDPNFFKGDYEPRVKLKATLDQEKQMKMRDLKEWYGAMVGNPFINQQAMTRLITQKAFGLEPDDVITLMNTPEQMQAAQQNAQQIQQKPDKTPDQIALEGIAKAYAAPTTAPDIKGELEQIAGLTVSATHQGAMEQAAAEHVSAADAGNTQTPTNAAGPGGPSAAPPIPLPGLANSASPSNNVASPFAQNNANSISAAQSGPASGRRI